MAQPHGAASEESSSPTSSQTTDMYLNVDQPAAKDVDVYSSDILGAIAEVSLVMLLC